jgi:demethylmenaquinone methyltransferase/2-methoxy-6-polyprenyl-1,4-benzoquinol methylase
MAMTLPTDAGKRHYVERMFDRIALRYDLMNRVMTLGIDRSWRARAIDAIEPCRGDVVIDLGCGTGDLARAAAARGARSLGVDVAAGMLEQARARDRATLLVRADGLALPLADASCDAAVSGFVLRNFTDVGAALAECGRVLKDGGRLALLEVDVPASRVLRLVFDAHFNRVVPLLGRLLSDGDAYGYLSSSLVYLPTETELASMLAAAGFENVCKRRLTGGVAQLVTARRMPRVGDEKGRGHGV